MPGTGFPWINIPMIADTGEELAFVQRREELAVLYRGMVEAGNSLRAGRLGVHRKFVVHGYLGVGKSALVLQALRMIREPMSADGIAADLGLPPPEDPERWLILRVSGKHVFGLDGMVDSLRRNVLDDETAQPVVDELHPESRLALYAEVHQQVASAVPDVLQLSPLHRLLRTRESQLYEQLRADLRELAKAIDHITYQVATAETSESGAAASEGREAAHERRERDEAHILVEVLNRFFRTASAAGLPTLLILDDFDDIAVASGASAERRARMLSSLLSEFTQLAPTCMVLTLRSEYMNDSVLRQYRRIYLPPLNRTDARIILGIWAQAQHPPLDAETTQRLQELGDRFLKSFDVEEPVVIPFRFLQLVTWLANNLLIYQLQDADEEKMLLRYFGSKYPLHAVRALRHVVELMPPEHIAACANASPLEGAPYAALTPHERLALERSSLLRPAVASDPTDPRLVLDPLCAFLRAASNRSW
ncbi:MAG TPA: hypothetical protein PLA87_20275 [Pseudomonadota bacterium]|nr:hypothetical protein [Pseudomonadota bacterium]